MAICYQITAAVNSVLSGQCGLNSPSLVILTNCGPVGISSNQTTMGMYSTHM